MEENQVEQTAETQEEAPQAQEQPSHTFTQDEVNSIVERRLAKERGSMYKKLGVEDLDMNNPTDRKKYSEYRKIRNSKPSTIVVNN